MAATFTDPPDNAKRVGTAHVAVLSGSGHAPEVVARWGKTHAFPAAIDAVQTRSATVTVTLSVAGFMLLRRNASKFLKLWSTVVLLVATSAALAESGAIAALRAISRAALANDM